MCGIVSIRTAGPPADKRLLKNAADALAHRGPDGEGFYLSQDGRTGLGHRRLSIIDLSTGGQPLSNEDGTVHIVVNGEFYDFERIRHDLIKKGHRFRTSSDSEIAVHSYEEYGLNFVDHLRGEFAIILLDERQNRLVAVRDRFGIKPLCHAQGKDGTLYLASEAKAIFAAGFNAAWDEYAFFHAASVQYTPPDRTLFAGVKQLQPGHMLVEEQGKTRIRKYWDLDYPQEPVQNGRSDDEWIEYFGAELEDAVKLRLRADVPLCFHLSGGLDSSAVAALGMKLHGSPLPCFTVSFSEESYDELPVAREMAEKMGAPLHVVSVSQDDLVHCIPEAVWYAEGLAINGHLAGKFLLSRAIRAAGVKVALTGEGSDELLAGYPHLREDLIRHSSGGAAQLDQLYANNAKLAGVFLSHGEALPAEPVEKALGYVPSFIAAKASLGWRVNQVLSDGFRESMLRHDVYADVAGAFDIPGQLAGRHVVNQSSYLWTKMTLANYILRTLGDGCEMANSIEGRLPFLDHILFERMRQLPLHLKIRDMTEKYVLREALRPLITDTIYRRQKHPFMAPPVSRFSNSGLNVFIQDMLRSKDFSSLPFFDNKKMLAWLDALPGQGEKDQAAAEPVLMMALTALLIHKKFRL